MAAIHSTILRCLTCLATATVVIGCNKAAADDDSTTVSQAGVFADSAQSETPAIALPVKVEAARDGDLVLSIITSGQVQSEHQAELKAEIGGTVQNVLVRPGQSVKRGDVLVALDPKPFDLVLRQRQADLDRANQTYLDLWLPDSVATGRVPTEDRKRAAAIRSGLVQARLSLESAQLDMQRANIVAPFDGVIDRVDVTEGERIGGGQAVATVVDMQHLRIEAAVLEHDIPMIKPGGDATVSSSASPGVTAHGTIMAVLAIVDSNTHAGRAYVRLNGNGVLRPGMVVDVRLESRRLKNRRLVPKRAVVERDGGRPLVFVVKDGRANWVYIRPGLDNGLYTEVLPDSITNEIPVKVGDEVIVQNNLTLTHQALVKIIRDDDKS
jgi:RND family efflux transporter MFP subunit